VWAQVKESFPIQLHRKELANAKHWVFDLLLRSSSLNATVLAVTCWHI
jgi:hypothetical protein